ncbi:MAG: helix-turn-helix domain-containing protein [Aminipila sp.]
MYRKSISIRLKALRLKAHLSQSQLGDAVGFTKQAISDIENGRRSTTAEKLAIIADFFNVSVDYLIGRTDKPEINK